MLTSLLLGGVVLWYATATSLQTLPVLSAVAVNSNMPQLLDRYGSVLDISVERGWNTHEQIELHQVPAFMQESFLLSEDKRFFSHNGVDWQARVNALWQSVMARASIRGASTLTEQVVRMVHPRPRTLWSKWLETVEAQTLERQETKWNILRFYLNQLPYGAERRGVAQAGRYYFGRDLDTLSPKEMLALVVLARAPGLLSKPEYAQQLERRVLQLALRLRKSQTLTEDDYQHILAQRLNLSRNPPSTANVFHFARHVWENTPRPVSRVQTTLDAALQQHIAQLLNERLAQLAGQRVENGAVLVADHQRHEILAWVVSGNIARNTPGAFIDAVKAPRQPGSTLKPFIYAMALEQGWTAATRLQDEPLDTAVGHGMHSYRNFSRVFYGEITLREALANSLNIPAVKTLDYVGIDTAIEKFQHLGMHELSKNPAIYGEGLALGNGEVSLFELVQAYTVLADRGHFTPLRSVGSERIAEKESVFSEESTSIISNILSDTHARQWEFGSGSSLSFPIETAAKTGTSTDHRDAWIVAYNHRYIVGIWMGNLTREPMRDVTGSTGPALLAHSIFAELNRGSETRPLYLSANLIQHPVCAQKSATGECSFRDEWFVPGSEPAREKPALTPPSGAIKIARPSEGLMLALDPRIPDTLEAFEFALNIQDVDSVRWIVDGKNVATTTTAKYSWPLNRGRHVLYAELIEAQGTSRYTEAVSFTVK